MSCKYCDDTGVIKDMPCPDADCIVGKAFKTQLVKYTEHDSDPANTIVLSSDEDDKSVLSEGNQDKMMNAVREIRELVVDAKENKSAFDLLRYRFKDNGLVLFVYGPKENQDKVIDRLEQVVNKYKKKKSLSLSRGEEHKTSLPLPTDKGFSFRKLLNK